MLDLGREQAIARRSQKRRTRVKPATGMSKHFTQEDTSPSAGDMDSDSFFVRLMGARFRLSLDFRTGARDGIS
jgi:hypothetical protein